jgi:hypothetical protein
MTGDSGGRARPQENENGAQALTERTMLTAALLTGIHDDKWLRQMLLERYVIPGPENQHNIIEDAVASGDFKRVTDHPERQIGTGASAQWKFTSGANRSPKPTPATRLLK